MAKASPAHTSSKQYSQPSAAVSGISWPHSGSLWLTALEGGLACLTCLSPALGGKWETQVLVP